VQSVNGDKSSSTPSDESGPLMTLAGSRPSHHSMRPQRSAASRRARFRAGREDRLGKAASPVVLGSMSKPSADLRGPSASAKNAQRSNASDIAMKQAELRSRCVPPPSTFPYSWGTSYHAGRSEGSKKALALKCLSPRGELSPPTSRRSIGPPPCLKTVRYLSGAILSSTGLVFPP
jgi:hypothetical protein